MRPSPLRQERHALRLPAGLSLAEIIEECHAAFPFSNKRRLHITLGGHEVPAEFWPRVRVKPGVTVNIVAIPGKNAFKAILGLVVALAALFLAPVIGAALGGIFASSVAVSLIGAGISIGGSMVLNALFPVGPQGGADTPKTTYSIGGSKNAATRYGAIPVIFVATGFRRRMPPVPTPSLLMTISTCGCCSWSATGRLMSRTSASARRRSGGLTRSNLSSAKTNAGDPHPQYAAEGEAMRNWRSAVWVYVNTEMDRVLTGQRPQPTIDELLAGLPPIVWP